MKGAWSHLRRAGLSGTLRSANRVAYRFASGAESRRRPARFRHLATATPSSRRLGWFGVVCSPFPVSFPFSELISIAEAFTL